MSISYKKIHITFEFGARNGVLSPSVVGFVDTNANRERERDETLRFERQELAWTASFSSPVNLFKKKCILAAAAPVGTTFRLKVRMDDANGKSVASHFGKVRKVPGGGSENDNVARIVMVTLGEPS